jgi:hypothetical protein
MAALSQYSLECELFSAPGRIAHHAPSPHIVSE